MTKVKLKDINDDYFYEHGYFRKEENRDNDGIITGTEKWRKLFDTVQRTYGYRKIITPEMLVKTINSKTIKRRSLTSEKEHPNISNFYRRKRRSDILGDD